MGATIGQNLARNQANVVLHWSDFVKILAFIPMAYCKRDVSYVSFALTHCGQDKMAAIFSDSIFKCIFLNENVWIPIKISLKFVLKGPVNNIPALVQIMAWRRPGDGPLYEPLMVSSLTHICVTQPQWVKPSIQGIHCHLIERKMFTLLVLKQEYHGKNKFILWLLMLWLLEWPGHELPWYWWYRINRLLSFTRNISCRAHLLGEKWYK